MKKFRLILTMLLAGVFSWSSYAQDVQIPFSWVGPGLTNNSSIGLFQCGTMNINLNTAGTQHEPDFSGTRALIPTSSGNLEVPFTLTFSKPVCNLRLLVHDLDISGGDDVERVVFSGALPDGIESSTVGPLFDFDGTQVFPNGVDESAGWVVWSEPVTEINFSYFRESLSWAMTLDSLSFDCDCSIPTDLNCCYGNDWQTLSWAEVPGAVGYQVDFGFNDNAYGCCDTVTGLPYGWLENVTDNIFVVPDSFEDCFWWRVRTEFADGSFSDWSERVCDCDEEEVLPCVPPTNLDCDIINTAYERELSWDLVPGALGYELSITYNDLECCPVGSDPEETVVVSTTGTTHNITSPNACFSWKVRTICTDDPTYSDWSETKCSSDCAWPTAKVSNPDSKKRYDPDGVVVSKMEVSIVPNPADDFVTVTMQGTGQEETYKNTKVILTSTSGVQVFEGDISVNRAKEIALKSFAPGVYICTIVSGDEVLHSSRLIVK